MLTRNHFLNCKNVPKTEVEIPEFGGKVFVKGLSLRHQLTLKAMLEEKSDYRDVYWLIACVVDEAGENLFTEADKEALLDLPQSVLLRIFNAALEINSLTPEKVAEAEKKDTGRSDVVVAAA